MEELAEAGGDSPVGPAAWRASVFLPGPRPRRLAPPTPGPPPPPSPPAPSPRNIPSIPVTISSFTVTWVLRLSMIVNCWRRLLCHVLISDVTILIQITIYRICRYVFANKKFKIADTCSKFICIIVKKSQVSLHPNSKCSQLKAEKSLYLTAENRKLTKMKIPYTGVQKHSGTFHLSLLILK